MVSGVITLTGVSKGRFNGGIDPTSKFNLLKELASTWLTVTPTVVPLPLVPMGAVSLREGTRHEQHYLASLPDELGGKRVELIQTQITKLLSEDPAAPHFITVCSSLHPEEIEHLANGVKRFPFQPGGRGHVFFNPCYATVDPLTDTAEAYVCDFRGGRGVRELLSSFLQQGTLLTNGFSRTEQLVLASQVAERSLPEEIEREITRLLDHL
jgi:hypothetical protein